MQGSYIDKTEFTQPWIFLLLNFISENFDKEEAQGSFQPLNVGFGWANENQETDERETSQETDINTSGEV